MATFRSLAIVDNTDPDNLACVLALANAKVNHELLGVIVTGRAANFDRNAPIDVIQPSDSQLVLKLNVARMQKFLNTAGHHDIPVFIGSIAPHTIVPHNVHIDEREFMDPSYFSVHGGLSAAISCLTKELAAGNEVDIIVGGPMTDLVGLIPDLPIKERGIRSIHAQFGSFGFGEKGLMEFGDKPRGKRQFNVACDPSAAHEVLMNLDAAIYLYPSDITRVDAIGFSDPDDLANHLNDTPAARELVRLYRIAYEKMVKPRGEKIYVHDFAPALGYLDKCSSDNEVWYRGASEPQKMVYRLEPVEIVNVPHLPEEKDRWGEIEANFKPNISSRRRYVATKLDPDRYLRELRRLVR